MKTNFKTLIKSYTEIAFFTHQTGKVQKEK